MYNKQLSTLLDQSLDDIAFLEDIPMSPKKQDASFFKGVPPSTTKPLDRPSQTEPKVKKKKKTFELEEVSRWTMVKRIF